MSDQQELGTKYNDGMADVVSTIVIMSAIVAMAVFWISGQ